MVAAVVESRGIRVQRYDATGEAVGRGNAVAANLVLLSAAIHKKILPASREMLVQSVEKITPSKRMEGNLKAIEAGMK